MKISGAIFDLDDTLTYSEHIWEGIPQMFLKRHGKVAEEDIDRKIINLNTAQIGEYFKEHYFQDSKRTAKSIVTEFGIARLRGKTLWQRTRELIAVAHPDFRDQLLYDARKMNIIV